MSTEMTFDRLIDSINETHRQLSRQAKLAVNTSLTVRNWLIGLYIAEYQLHGADRAVYGDKLLPKLSASLKTLGVSGTGRRQLYNYLSFYRTYPEIVRSATAQLHHPPDPPPGGQSLPLEGSWTGAPEKVWSATAQTLPALISAVMATQSQDDAGRLLARLSYTHFEQLIRIEDPDKQRFYEQRCVQATWSVRELKRQIASLYYERTALSTDQAALHHQTDAGAEREAPALDLRDPYVFEFLGLKPAEVMGESELEDALIDKLQGFLLELGHGFCFEARQKRLLIGETYNFVDLVFYHRVLKCHVLVELKVGPFTHEHIGQLNTYVSWYADNEMTEGDSPPIGLLLCTEKDHTVVKYALAGMNNQLFVSRYKVALPSEAEIQGVFVEVLT